MKAMNENELKQFEEKEIDRVTQKVISVMKESKTLTSRQINKIIDEELKDDSIYSGLQDYNIYYSKERIRTGVLTNKLLNQGKGNLSLSWFNFYVYFRLPAGIVLSFLLLFSGGLSGFLNLIDIVIIGMLFWGLKERKLWAYRMNFFALVAETVLRPLGRTSDMSGYIIFVIMAGLLWLLPNWIYFKKRKYLFLYSNGNNEDGRSNRVKWNFNLKGNLARFYHFIVKNKIIILIVLVLAVLFYWYGYRPSKIRHDCSWRYSEPGNRWYPANEKQYDFCIHEKGL